ncbi:MAG TPA: chromosomal replication initiator protein DnaA [Bacteroidota bacterium]|nr:chromosomal replication initiator protein DnaA [Bacteroidota bacterium]
MEPSTQLLVNPSEEEQARAVWSACLDRIRESVNTQSFKTWFEPMVPLSLRGGKLTVQVPSQFFYDWLEEHYYTVISETIATVLGKEAHLEYSVRTDEPQIDLDYGILPPPAPRADRRAFPPQPNSFTLPLQPAASGVRPEGGQFQTFLNPRYTFDNFIKGDSNQLARAAASAVANNPGGTSFNPLVIYGGTGLGKTHLIQAIGNHALANGKASRVIYVSSERFTVEFVEAIQRDTTSEFAGFYRSMDILIVDDIQFFAGKERTQDHFFHTFNELHQHGKQIVLSSDRPPKELKGLDDRLLSRFQWGLTSDIQPPDLETRIAILLMKSENECISIPQDVVECIATNVTSNIRELEGCLISLMAKASLEGREISVDLAREVIKVVVGDVKSPLTIETIQRTVCEYFNIPEDLIRAKTRKQEIVNARQVAMYLAKELTNCSLKTIGLHFGGRDHSTVIHAYQSVEDQMRIDQKYQTNVQQIRRRLQILGHV